MTKSEKLIEEIQDELNEAALDLKTTRGAQNAAIGNALAGDFTSAVKDATAAAKFLRSAKRHERDAAKDLTES